MLIVFNNPQGNAFLRSQQAAVFLLSLFLLISPFPHTQFVLEICFYSAALIFMILALHFGGRLEENEVLSLLLCFGIWSLIASIFALDRAASFEDLYSHFGKYLILTTMLVAFFGSRQGLVLLTRIFVVSGAIFSIFLMTYFYGVLEHDFSTRLGTGLPRWPIDTIGFVMLFSLALVFPLQWQADSLPKKFLMIVVVVLLVISAILTQSRATFLGLVVVLCISCYRNFRLLMVMLAFVFSFAYFFTPLPDRFNQGDVPRVALIRYSVEVIKDFPISGIGFSLDTFRDPQYVNPSKYTARIPEAYRNVVSFLWPHNMFLDVAIRTGLIGVLLFSGFLCLAFWRLIKLMREGEEKFIRDWALGLLAALAMFVVKGSFEQIFMHFVEVMLYSTGAMLVILSRLQRGMIEKILPKSLSEFACKSDGYLHNRVNLGRSHK